MAAFEMIVNLRTRGLRKTMTRRLPLSCGFRDCISVLLQFFDSWGTLAREFGDCLQEVTPRGGERGGNVFVLTYVTKGKILCFTCTVSYVGVAFMKQILLQFCRHEVSFPSC